MAALGVVLWAAALAAALRLVGDGGLDWAPLVIVASGAGALALEHRARSPRVPREAERAPAAGPSAPAVSRVATSRG